MDMSLNLENYQKNIFFDLQTIKIAKLFNLKNWVINYLDKKLNKIILAATGFENYIFDLQINKAEKELLQIKKTSTALIKTNEKLEKINFFDNQELREKFNFCIKLLFSLENKLHIQVYCNKEKIATNNDLIDGVHRMNAQNIDKLLAI